MSDPEWCWPRRYFPSVGDDDDDYDEVMMKSMVDWKYSYSQDTSFRCKNYLL